MGYNNVTALGIVVIIVLDNLLPKGSIFIVRVLQGAV